MLEIWTDIRKRARKKDIKLPDIIPIVLYNGEEKLLDSIDYKEILFKIYHL
ncbi:hypothetical protein JCM16816_08500 [Thermoanaerobacter brockii subsp. lactiethylicus]|jgi:hypothetical protein|uniref:Transposase (putative) YhgA-like domain-containing protein n=1 Tax=Thermoanaerobacter brockii subsp. finnii (strain ATCC 43586 / DSM 3389 / AKO-1) TaxID=509193 RepID=E8UV48_THEBF|nr:MULTISPECIES: hypothetical protein [Thermoanaerobacter]ADV80169.1 hypothetical protein Thebr_1610 [Thermoanaerobacter brockii subsp. finnii Ako-1]KUJ89761.1 MAG: hypothetical protein XD37_2018 [Thermoanaerobacter thermocopriae]HAA81596.1 hypothetical protein [Thermoanaerobacter sp.]